MKSNILKFSWICSALVAQLVFSQRSFAGEPTKAEIEQRTGVFIWNWGSRFDEDPVVDLFANCGGVRFEGPSTNFGYDALFNSEAGKFKATQTRAESQKILKELGLNESDFHSSVVTAHFQSENQPIYFIYPEFHLSAAVPDKYKIKHQALHESEGPETFSSVEHFIERNMVVLNLIEGPRQDHFSPLNKYPIETKADRRTAFEKLRAEKLEDAAMLLGDVFKDKIQTFWIDDASLFLKWALVATAEIQKTQGQDFGWPSLKEALLKGPYGNYSDLFDVETLRPLAESLTPLEIDQIHSKQIQACDERSDSMVNYAMELAQKTKAQVIFVRVGMKHTGEILRQLRNANQNYLVFSPNVIVP